MSYLKERVSYLKGLADGMQIGESTNEGKLLKAMVEVLDDMALSIEDLEEVQEELSQQVDFIDEDVSQLENIIFDEDDEDFCSDNIECPYCNEEIDVDDSMIDFDKCVIECPSCHKQIEFSDECDCEDCCDH